MIRRLYALLRGFVFVAAFASSANAQDAAKGETLFEANCGGCHTVDKGGDNSAGLSLYGVVGRKAGSAPSFDYSPAMHNSGIVWTAEKLDAFIASPGTVVPSSNMYFDGLSDPSDRASLIAYLKTLN